jgi:hypothetical protein
MNIPEEDLANSDLKAKTEIKKGLSDEHNISERPKKKSVKVHSDPEDPGARLTESKDVEKEMGALNKTQEDADSKKKEKEVKVKELETLLKDSDHNANLLKEQLPDKQGIEETYPELSSKSHVAFRIDFYLREGDYHGIVKLLPSKEGMPFKGKDLTAIIEFINGHFPKPEESVVVTPGPVSPVALESVENQMKVFKMASIRKFCIATEGMFHKEKSIPRDKIFQLSLVIDPLESIVEEDLPCPYNISVYAKRMGGGFKQVLGKSDGQIIRVGEFFASIHCFPLPAGIYRIVAFGTINIKNNMKESIIGFHESSIFLVS